MNTQPIYALVIDDDPSWQEILKEILEDNGLDVDLSDGVEDALKKLHQKNYRLAIVDLSLAGIDHHNQDGLTILDQAKRLVPGIVTILLTGYASVELAVNVIQTYGAYTCLRKETFKRAEFRQLIREALASPVILNKNEDNGKSLEKKSEDQGSQQLRHPQSALLVEDDAGWRSLLSEIIKEAGYQVYSGSSYGEALGVIKREQFQLAILDLSLASSIAEHNLDGFQLLSSINQMGIPAIIVSGAADPNLIDQAFRNYEIFAFFEKQSFERVSFLEVVGKVSSQSGLLSVLTEREIEVLTLVAQGLTNKEIASALFISVNTVKRHLKPIFEKLEVNSRAAASAYAIRMGLGREN